MERILPLELVGYKELEYDLLDENGDLVVQKGEQLTASILMKLSYMKLYKHEHKPVYTLEEKQREEGINLPDSLIAESSTEHLLGDTRDFLQKAYDGVPIKLDDCIKSAKIIIEEVAQAIDNIDSINQLRVYDEYTYSHNINVSSLSTAVGMYMNMSENEIKELALAAFLHDIGKMKVPKEILNKPGKLDITELEIMRRHTSLGYRYIKENFDVPDRIARVALDHHEKFVGKGYPNGLHGKMINRYAQIASVVDIYDALVSDRVYKKGIPAGKVIHIMKTELRNEFNEEVFDKFISLAVSKKDAEIPEESGNSGEPPSQEAI